MRREVQVGSGFPVVSVLESGRVRQSPLHRLGVLEKTWLPVAVETRQITSTDGGLRVVEGAIRASKLGEGGGDGCRTMLITPRALWEWSWDRTPGTHQPDPCDIPGQGL